MELLRAAKECGADAVKRVLLSAFSNAGQYCVSGSRTIIFNSVYDKFRDMLVERALKLRVGPMDDDDFGPVINEECLNNMPDAVHRASRKSTVVLIGGNILTDSEHRFKDVNEALGIAEQDMVSMAGRMALPGLLPIVNSFGVFQTSRARSFTYPNSTRAIKLETE